MQEETETHYPFAARMFRDDGDAEPRDGADYRHDDEEGGGRSLRYTPFFGNGYQQTQDDGVGSTSPEVNTNQVPKGGGALDLPKEHVGPQRGNGSLFLPANPG